MIIAEALRYWEAVEPRRTGTIRRYRASIKRLERIGIRTLDDVTRDRVLDVQRGLLARGLSVVSVRTELAALRSVCAQLEAHGLFPTGRLAEVRKVALPVARTGRRRRMRYLTRGEFERLANTAAHICPRVEMPLRVAALAGLRVGELARMRAEDIRGRFFWVDSMPEYGEAGSCKTGPRSVPICSELVQVLDALPKQGWLFPSGTMSHHGRRPKTPFLSRWTLENDLKRVRRVAALGDDVTWIVLRHTRASWWLQGGASIYKVSDWLGHDVATCESYYGSLVDAYDPECERMPEVA